MIEPLTFHNGTNSVTLYHGDCLELLPTLTGIDAVVTDPPYGISNKTKKAVVCDRTAVKGKQCHTPYGRFEGEIVGDDKPFDPVPWLKWPCVFWGAGYFHERLPRGGWLLWDKKTEGKYRKWSVGDGDMAWCSREGAPRIFTCLWMGFIRGEIERPGRGGANQPSQHPNQKPIALMEWSMEQAKIPVGATVLDPYMGSATTAIACIRTGRNFVGIELDARHYKTAVERVTYELSQGKLL